MNDLTDLLSDPHIIHVEEGEHWEPLDWSNILKNQDRLTELYGILMNDLSVGYVVDNFENHSERKDYFSRRIPQFNQFLTKNCLSINHINSFFNAILALKSQYQGPQQEEISAEVNRIEKQILLFTGKKEKVSLSGDTYVWHDYDLHTNSEKFAFVKGLKQEIYGVMKLVAKVNELP